MTERLSVQLEDALAAAAGAERPVAVVSLLVDYGAAGQGTAAISTTVDRATKSLVFASATAVWPDGRSAAAAQGIFRVLE